MTMPLTPEQLKTYLQTLAKEKGFDADRTTRLTSLIEGDGDITLTRQEARELLTPIVEHPFARHATFAKSMDEVKEKHQTLEKWHREQALPAVERSAKEVERLNGKLAKFVERYGDLEDVTDIGGGKGVTKTGDVVDMNKVNELLNQQASNFLMFEKDKDRIVREHFSRFGEIPNVTQLMELISERAQANKQMTLDDAYNELHGDRVKEFDDKAKSDAIEAEVNKRLAAERARRPADVPGAGRVESTGAFWAQQSAATKDDKSAPANLSDSERADAFAADLTTELQKREVPI
jgi:hypothetical protein